MGGLRFSKGKYRLSVDQLKVASAAASVKRQVIRTIRGLLE